MADISTSLDMDKIRAFLEDPGAFDDIEAESKNIEDDIIRIKPTINPAEVESIKAKINLSRIHVDWQNSDGSTLLHLAVDRRRTNLARILLSLNANPFLRDRTGRLAYNADGATSVFAALNSFANQNREATPVIVKQSFHPLNGDTNSENPWYYPLNIEQLEGRKPDLKQQEKQRERLRGRKVTLVEIECNHDLTFTRLISNIAHTLGYAPTQYQKILKFFSKGFLEESASIPQLRFREPSCHILIARRKYQELDVSSASDDTVQNEDCIQNHDSAHQGTAQNQGTSSAGARQPRTAQKTSLPLGGKPMAPNIVSIVLPYLHSTTMANLEARRRSWQDQKSPKLETSYYEPRTLDEWFYTSLNYSQLSIQNEKQVMIRLVQENEKKRREEALAREEEKSNSTKSQKKRSDEKEKELLLMVPQLWLGRVDEVVITALASDMSGPDPITHLKSEIKKTNIDLSTSPTSLQLTALILSECINFLDRPVSAGLPQSPFYRFENAVTGVFEEVQKYTKEVTIQDDSVDKERGFTLRVDDIRNELVMIENVIDQQDEIWQKFYKTFKDDFNDWKTSNVSIYEIAIRPEDQIPKFKRRLKKINGDAERVRDLVAFLLDLKMKHASMRESHNSALLGVVVLGLTISTIIFAPLSFITSLLALPVDKLDTEKFSPSTTARNSNSTTSNSTNSSLYHSVYVARWLGCGVLISLAATLAIVVLCYLASREYPKIKNLLAKRKQKARQPATKLDGDSEKVIGAKQGRLSDSLRPRKPRKLEDEENQPSDH